MKQKVNQISPDSVREKSQSDFKKTSRSRLAQPKKGSADSYRDRLFLAPDSDRDSADIGVALEANLVPPISQKPVLIRIAIWVTAKNIPFLIVSIGMIVMLFWAGTFKMTEPGAEGIIPLVSNSPLISWHFQLFGPYIGSDLIGLTEWAAGLLLLLGFFKPKFGIAGGIIGVVMFFITSSMLLTTPDAIINVNGMGYMNNLGLFLYKDIINLGASFYLISHFGKNALEK